MSVVLLDTSVASLLHPKKRAKSLREKYEPHMRGQTLALCFQTVAELWDWAETNLWKQEARDGLEAFVRQFLVIPCDFELAKVWARLMHSARSEGRRFESGDCWIVATAVYRQIPLLTHDRDMVGRTIPGLELVTYLDATRPK